LNSLLTANAPTTTTSSDYDYASCGASEFECTSDTGVCIPLSAVCDGVADCNGNEDEKNCSVNSKFRGHDLSHKCSFMLL